MDEASKASIFRVSERFSYEKVFVICFISQWMKRSKHALFVFPPKKKLIWRGLCSIGQSCCSMTSKRIIVRFLESSRDEVFSPEHSLNQSKATRVCIRSINQSNRSLACSRCSDSGERCEVKRSASASTFHRFLYFAPLSTI